MRELTDRAIDTATQAGASYADIRIEQRRRQAVGVKNGSLDAVSNDRTQGFGVRALVNGAWGFASSSRLEQAEVDRVARLAVDIARASVLALRTPIDLGMPTKSVGAYHTPVVRDPFAVSLDEKLNLLMEADAAMRRAPGVAIAEASLDCLKIEKVFASSEGSYVEQTLIETGGGIEATAINEHDLQKRSYPNSFGRQQGTRGFELIEEMDLPGNGERIAGEAVQVLTAAPCPEGRMTIILDGTQTALQVHESCGHAIELDRVFGMEASYAGTSFLTTDKRGRFRYGSEQVNIVADATVPGGLGTFGFDDEGVPAQRTTIVDHGEFKNYITSRETAARLGEISNGTMRASGWNRIPLIRMTNINLQPGDWSFADLVADTDDGIYLQTNKSWSIDDKRLNFQFGTEIAWRIRNGKLAEMIRNPSYAGITPEFWGSCDAVCNDWHVWGTPNCGKGQPSQTAHVGHGAAPARFRDVRVGVVR
jgi:TldD protein